MSPKRIGFSDHLFQSHHHPLLHDYINEEHRLKDRLVAVNDHFTALVPFWGIWPFEIW